MASMDAYKLLDGTNTPLTTQAPNPMPNGKFGADENGKFPEGPDDDRDHSSAFKVIPVGGPAASEAAATASGNAGLFCDDQQAFSVTDLWGGALRA